VVVSAVTEAVRQEEEAAADLQCLPILTMTKRTTKRTTPCAQESKNQACPADAVTMDHSGPTRYSGSAADWPGPPAAVAAVAVAAGLLAAVAPAGRV